MNCRLYLKWGYHHGRRGIAKARPAVNPKGPGALAVTCLLLAVHEALGKARGLLVGLFLGAAILSRQMSIYASLFLAVHWIAKTLEAGAGDPAVATMPRGCRRWWFDRIIPIVFCLVQIGGTLTFARDRDTLLCAGLVRIAPGETFMENGFDCEAHQPKRDPNQPRAALEIGTAEEPIPAGKTEAMLRGKPLDSALVKEAAAMAASESSPISDQRRSRVGVGVSVVNSGSACGRTITWTARPPSPSR